VVGATFGGSTICKSDLVDVLFTLRIDADDSGRLTIGANDLIPDVTFTVA